MFQARKWAIAAAALLAGMSAGAASAGVPEGIAAWQAGDYATAVREWRQPAEAGDADAQFNLAQAYRLGRGVPQDLAQAEQWYTRAARQRHEQAGTNLGLMLFQNGRAREAMPWIQAAALRGDPRAQYVFGTALFNGDVVQRDLPRAWALMSAAAEQGFPQAVEQLRAMEPHVGAEDRQRARAAARELGLPPAQQAATPRPGSPAVTRPLPRSSEPPVRVAEADRPRPRPQPEPSREPRRDPPRAERPAPPAPAPAASGRWRVQLGAFSSREAAQRQWATVRRVAGMGGLQPYYSAAGRLTRVQAGPVASRAAAERLCSAVRAAGEACVIVAP